MERSICPNLNHSRSNVPVRHCPRCGGIVNASISPRSCTEAEHDDARRSRNKFCVHCGGQLVK